MRYMLLLLTIGVLSTPAMARVKLITLPVRERVEVQLDHSHATLVEEQRVVPLIKGLNQVDFSWAGTNIDPHTIVFRVIGPAPGDEDQPVDAKVLSVSYPPGENALVWDVAADRSGSALVRISYLLGGLTKSFDYRAVVEHDESTLSLSQYIRVQNFANESFDDTSIQLGFGDSLHKPIGINETKQVLVGKFDGIPVRKTYTCDVARYSYIDHGQRKVRIPMHYVIRNDSAHKLGRAALPGGKVRLFQKDSQGTTAFIGEDWGQFTPNDDEMRLYLGVAQDVSVKRTIERRDREPLAGNLSNYHVVVKYEIENFKNTAVTLDINEQLLQLRQEAGFGGDRPVSWSLGEQTTLPGKPDAEHTDSQQVMMHVDLSARKGDKAEKTVYLLHIVFHNEWN